MSAVSPALCANHAALYLLLTDKYGHAVERLGSGDAARWWIDKRMTYWPAKGRYKMGLTYGGKGGTLRGSPESSAEQLHKVLRCPQ